MNRPLLPSLVLGFALLGTSPGLRAQPAPGLEPSLVVLELYMDGSDYPKTQEYVERVSEEIGKTGRFSLLERADAERQISGKMTTSSRRVTDEKLKEIEQMMKEGDKLLYEDPRRAIEILAEAKSRLKVIMESLSLNQKIRHDFFRTQMMLARSHFDNQNPEKARHILEEIIRVFGDEAQVTEADYHPAIVRMYREAYRKMSSIPKGSVHITTLPPGAEVLIHGKPRKKPTPATYGGLYPGDVAVQARKGGRESMVHKVKIEAGQTKEIRIDIDYETSLSFNDKRFGFTFSDTDTMTRRLPDFASRVGKMLSVDYVLVSGLMDKDGRTYLKGFLVNVSKGSVERVETLYTKPNVVSKNRVRQLALAVSDSGYQIQKVYKPWYTNWIGWTGVGVGVVGMALGGAFLADFNAKMDDVNCTYPPPDCKPFVERTVLASDAKNSRALSGVMFAVGGVGLVGGVLAFLLIHEEDEEAGANGPVAQGLHLQQVAPVILHDGSTGLGAAFTF